MRARSSRTSPGDPRPRGPGGRRAPALQPHLGGAGGPGRARAPRHPADGRGGGDRGALRRYQELAVMDKFNVLNGVVAPLDRANVDTDQIIPKQYLASIKKTGYAEGLFASWRRDPEFVLNQARYKGAQILLARKNFGCGSSREHAPWALMEYGFRCVIAPSYGDIFYNNSFKNGFLPVVLAETEVDSLFYDCALPGFRLVVDLERQTVATTDGSKSFRFEVDASRKYSLLNGLDEIGLTLRHAVEIRAFEARRKTQFPWHF